MDNSSGSFSRLYLKSILNNFDQMDGIIRSKTVQFHKIHDFPDSSIYCNWCNHTSRLDPA